MSVKKMKVNDRVRRVNDDGCQGAIKDIRAESVSVSGTEEKDKPLMVNVLWDNGTLSVLAPEALEVVK